MAETVKEVLDWFSRHDATTSLSAAAAAALAAPADGIDRISALPDDLLRDIVSRLPIRDAARTTGLATRWRGLWLSAPLILRDADLLGSSDDEEDSGAVAAVGRVLTDHQGPFLAVHITSFSLAFQDRESELAEWSRLLAAKGVQDLAILDKSPSINWGMHVPVDILRSTSLRRLFLGCRAFPDTDTASGDQPGTNITFPNLLELFTFASRMSDQDLKHILASSPKLVTLALIFNIRMSPERIHLRSQSLECMLLWLSTAEEVAVIDAPCLKRLILWKANNIGESGDRQPLKIKIDRAPELLVLGYLNPRKHQLQIGNIIINSETRPSPGSTVPSVKILALNVDFSVLEEVNMLCSFLRCFPNVDTLHIKSCKVKATGRHHAMFWGLVAPIECLKSHVKNIVIHEFQGEQSELDFLDIIAKRSQKLRILLLMLAEENFTSQEELNEVHCQLEALGTLTWATQQCEFHVLFRFEAEIAWSFSKASDLSVKNPFF